MCLCCGDNSSLFLVRTVCALCVLYGFINLLTSTRPSSRISSRSRFVLAATGGAVDAAVTLTDGQPLADAVDGATPARQYRYFTFDARMLLLANASLTVSAWSSAGNPLQLLAR